MKIILHAKNFEITPSLQKFVDQKIASLAKFFKEEPTFLEARVEVGRPSLHHKKGLVFYAEINVKFGKNLLRSTVEDFDVRTALDKARDKMETQIIKIKSRYQ